jgi:hypothetical protein
VFVLQASGACYSWRLPPPGQIGGKRLREAHKEDCAVLRSRICKGDCAHPAEIAKSNSIGLCVSLSYLTSGRFLWRLLRGLAGNAN